jgi:hypothetical protein
MAASTATPVNRTDQNGGEGLAISPAKGSGLCGVRWTRGNLAWRRSRGVSLLAAAGPPVGLGRRL